MNAQSSAFLQFRDLLWPRINAFTVSLRRLSEGDPAAGPTLKELARSLAAAAADAGLGQIESAARNVLDASDDALPAAAQNALELLRNEALRSETGLSRPGPPDSVPGTAPVQIFSAEGARPPGHKGAATRNLLGPDDFSRAFEQTVRQCAAEKLPVTLALIALGPAGSVAPRRGSVVDNAVVDRTASLLTSSFRSTDIVGQLDWGEFAVLFPGEDTFGAMRATQKVMSTLEATVREVPQANASFYCAAGVTGIEGTPSFESVLSAARNCLDEARAAGVGQIVTHDMPRVKQKQRVLIAGANEVVTRVLKGLFDKEGYETECARTVTDAQAVTGSHPFDALLVLEPLPDGDVTTLAENFRRTASHARVPIIAVLASPVPERIARVLESGIADYATTPFSPQAILLAVKQALTKGALLDRPAPQTRRLLFVDNDIKNLLLAGSAIHHKGGFVVYLALGLSRALARLDSVEPDVVVVPFEEDMSLLNVLAERVGERGGSLIFSAPEGTKPVFKGLVANVAKGVITKPFTPGKLLEQMERLCPPDVPGNLPSPPPEHLNAEIHRILQETMGATQPGRTTGGLQK